MDESQTNNAQPSGELNREAVAANSCKLMGNSFYKNKEFKLALDSYDDAIKLDSKEITFYMNKAAVYYVLKQFAKCIQECEKAVAIGRENNADFKLVAKALLRTGSAYKQLGEMDKARVYIHISYVMHRTPETLTKLSAVEKIIKEKERLDYVDLEESKKENKYGRKLFAKGDYRNAIKHFTEAIRRNPDDFGPYLNRSRCFLRLAEFNLALKDCEECLKLDSTSATAWKCLGKSLLGLKDCVNADYAFERAIELEPELNEKIAEYRRSSIVYFSIQDRVRNRFLNMRKFEDLLLDPEIRIILQQMIINPKAAYLHAKDPKVVENIMYMLSNDFAYRRTKPKTSRIGCGKIMAYIILIVGLLLFASVLMNKKIKLMSIRF